MDSQGYRMNYFHWQCNNKIRRNKRIAIVESVITNSKITFCCPDGYKNLNWSKEPEASWEDMLKDRAQELRDSYKKVRLWYSGGADSHRVLRAFVDNNIPLDEIVVKIKSPFLGGDPETTDVAIPTLQAMQHSLPGTKITIIDSSVKHYENFYANPDWYDELIRTNDPIFGTPGSAEIALCNTHFDPFAEDNCINIIARDKPHLVYLNKQWYAYWLDNKAGALDEHYADAVSSFYIDKPILHLKQCHMLKNYIESHFTPQQYNKIANYSSAECQTHWSIGCGRIDKDQTIRTRKKYNVFPNTGNTPGLIIPGLARAFYQTNSRQKEISRVNQFLNNGLEHIVRSWALTVLEMDNFANGTWWNNGRAEDDYLGIFSNFYCLGTGKIETVDDLFPNGFDKSKLP